MLSDLRAAARFAGGLGPFLRHTISLTDARALLERSLRERERQFLRLLDGAVFGNPVSPSRALLAWAGITRDRLAELIGQCGIERALEHLFDAGVYVTVDEFKGNSPILRPGLELRVRARDYGNPLAIGHALGTSGGTRSAGTALTVDLDFLAHESAYQHLIRASQRLEGRHMILWRPAPPGMAGIKIILRASKIGTPVSRWFSQTPVRWDADNRKYALFLTAAAGISRLAGRSLPFPEHVPLNEPETIARAIADHHRRGVSVLVDCPVSSGVRVSLAAQKAGLDISGAAFRVGGEPLTESKADIIKRSGCRVFCHYHISEFGMLGAACADPSDLDDVHVTHDKTALIRRPLDVDGIRVDALYATALHPSATRVVINAETGDHAEMADRECGCAFGRMGYSTHLTRIRSYEKLTSEGMTFLGSALVDVVERVLPGRFGGAPGDYQFVESELDGLPSVSIVVSPRVGDVDANALTAAVLDALSARSAPDRMMAALWRDGDTLRVQRREPFITRSAKVQTLHVTKPGEH